MDERSRSTALDYAGPRTDMHLTCAPRSGHVDVLHGRRIADPYRWLEDPTSAETQRWLRAQDALFTQHAEQWSGRAWLRRRISELLAFEVMTPPVWRGKRRFFTRRRPGQEHAVLLVAEADRERVLVDPMVLDPTGLTTLDAWQPSHEGDRLAIQTSVAGTEQASLVVLEVTSGQVLDGPIDRVRYSSIGWLPGGRAFYYVRFLEREGLHRGVWLHRLGTDPIEDALVFGADPEEPTRPGVSITPDGRWLMVSINYGTGMRNDLWLADLLGSDPTAPNFAALRHGNDGSTGLHIGYDGRLYLLTNLDAPRNRLCVTTPDRLAHVQWQELIPENPEANLQEFCLIDDPAKDHPQLLIGWTQHAFSQLTVHDGLSGEQIAAVTLPGNGTVQHLVARPEGGNRAWFEYTDPVTPPSVWCYDARTRTVRPWGATPTVARPPQVHTVQVDYSSMDGTLVRLSLFAPGSAPDHPRPTVLHAYGGFGRQRRPRFTASVLAWIEAGGVYAVAHVRGGGEQGTPWHHAGILANKQKTFDDFAAAARWLIDHNWTTVDRLCFTGGSNGGLVVGAVMTQHPELCNAVVAAAPLFDMVRYEHHGLGPLWTREYGTATDPTHLKRLLSYSPYHNVRADVAYPAALFTVFDQDARVDALHARKMCAALQSATAGSRPIILRRESQAGHGPRALSRAITVASDALAFAAHWTGLSFPEPRSHRSSVEADVHLSSTGKEVRMMPNKEELLLGVEEQELSESRDTPDTTDSGGDSYFDFV